MWLMPDIKVLRSPQLRILDSLTHFPCSRCGLCSYSSLLCLYLPFFVYTAISRPRHDRQMTHRTRSLVLGWSVTSNPFIPSLSVVPSTQLCFCSSLRLLILLRCYFIWWPFFFHLSFSLLPHANFLLLIFIISLILFILALLVFILLFLPLCSFDLLAMKFHGPLPAICTFYTFYTTLARILFHHYKLTVLPLPLLPFSARFTV